MDVSPTTTPLLRTVTTTLARIECSHAMVIAMRTNHNNDILLLLLWLFVRSTRSVSPWRERHLGRWHVGDGPLKNGKRIDPPRSYCFGVYQCDTFCNVHRPTGISTMAARPGSFPHSLSGQSGTLLARSSIDLKRR